jgi:hypothetical protein
LDLFNVTPIAATARSKAEVESQNSKAQIKAEVNNQPEPASPGPCTTHDAKSSEATVATVTDRPDYVVLARDAFARGDRR